MCKDICKDSAKRWVQTVHSHVYTNVCVDMRVACVLCGGHMRSVNGNISSFEHMCKYLIYIHTDTNGDGHVDRLKNGFCRASCKVPAVAVPHVPIGGKREGRSWAQREPLKNETMCHAMRCRAAPCSAVRCGAVRCRAVPTQLRANTTACQHYLVPALPHANTSTDLNAHRRKRG